MRKWKILGTGFTQQVYIFKSMLYVKWIDGEKQKLLPKSKRDGLNWDDREDREKKYWFNVLKVLKTEFDYGMNVRDKEKEDTKDKANFLDNKHQWESLMKVGRMGIKS